MRRILFCILLLVPVFSVYAQTDALARAYIQPDGRFLAGQQFTLYIQVQTETSFASSPTFPEVVLDSATAIRPEQLGIGFSERIRGKTYVGIRQRYLLSAQKAGVLNIPAYTFEFLVGADGAGEDILVTVETAAFDVNIDMPRGLDSIHNVAVTPSLKLSERYDPPLENLKVGDAFLRSVLLESNNALSFLLPEITFQAQAGLTIYPSSPRFEDNSVRGRSIGKRIDSASYILQEEGAFKLPEISVQWFDLGSNSLKVLSLEEKSFQVAPNPDILEVLVNNERETGFYGGVEKILEVVNWIILNIKLITLAILLLICGRFAWNKYASVVFNAAARFFNACRNSELFLIITLIFSCLFFSRSTIKKQLGIWVQKEANQKFRKGKSWGNINSNYSEKGNGRFSRWALLIELFVFGFRTKNKKLESQSKLNP